MLALCAILWSWAEKELRRNLEHEDNDSQMWRKKWSRQLFQESKEKGLVGDMVLSRFREAATPEDYKELMEGFSKRSLPVAWKRNVCEKSEYRRRVADKRKLLP